MVNQTPISRLGLFTSMIKLMPFVNKNPTQFYKLLKQTNVYLSISCNRLQDFLDGKKGSIIKLSQILGQIEHPFLKNGQAQYYEKVIGEIIVLPKKFNISYPNVIMTLDRIRKQLKDLRLFLGKERHSRFRS